MDLKIFEGQNENVKKYVFTKKDAVYEAVVYKYPDYKTRTVICCSVQSGCPVGCVFCGTGKNFIRNLSISEIIDQINKIIINEDIINYVDEIKKFQIMFMSMGEPMLNWENVKGAIKGLHSLYPKAQLLISTMGINDTDVMSDLISLAKNIDNIGLQYSLHDSIDKERDKIIPFKNKFSIRMMKNWLRLFKEETGRKPFINYCVTKDNHTEAHINRMLDLFSPLDVCFTFSVICNIDKNNKQDNTDYEALMKMQNIFLDKGYNVRIFDPAGKDDIGGGCGQLWYVQDWLKNHERGQ